jgi:multiple sugar transport system substrate-binding protein
MYLLSMMFLSALSLGCSGQSQRDKVTIRYYMWGTPTVISMHQKILAEFEKEYPNIHVQLETSTWPAYWDKLQIQVASRTEPDVYWMSGAYFVNFAQKDAFLNLTDFVKKDSIDFSKYYKHSEVFDFGGKLFGVPKDLTVGILYYNITLFDKAGVPYPKETWTWDDLLRAAKLLTKDFDGDGKIDQWGIGTLQGRIEEHLVPFICSNGGAILSEDRTHSLLDQPPAIQAIQFMVDLVHKYHVSPPAGQLLSVGGDEFATGQVAMTFNTSTFVPEYSKITAFQWDIAPIPKSPHTGKRITSFVDLTHVISKNTAHPEEAWELVRYMQGEKAQTSLAQMKTLIPSLKSVATTIYATSPPKHMAIIPEGASYARDLQFTATWMEWTQALFKEMEAAFYGKISAEQACRSASKAIDAILVREHAQNKGKK